MNSKTNMSILMKRKTCEYTFKDIIKIEEMKNIILSQIKLMELEDEIHIYPNQEHVAKVCVEYLYDKNIINIMIYGLTQSGKTGTILGFIKAYIEFPKNTISYKNIYIITGLSSRDWIGQTNERMPNLICDRIYHRDDLKKKFINDIKDKTNVLIIIDEVHIAAKKRQTLHDAFETLGFYDKQKLLENDIKILEFSATPDGIIYDVQNWGKHSKTIKMLPGEGYVSCFDLLETGRVKPYMELYCFDKKAKKVNEVKAKKNFESLNNTFKSYKKPKYHIIRTPNGDKPSEVVINNCKKFIDEPIEIIIYNQKTKKKSGIPEINTILSKEPSKHTIIFIKETLRCSKTLKKKYLGTVVERYTNNPDDAVIIQGLIGRVTGYDDNGEYICYTNVESIKNYKELWDSEFTNASNWKSKTTKRRRGKVVSKGTWLSPSHIKGMDNVDKTGVEPEPKIEKFKKFDEVIKFINDSSINYSPQEPKKINGYYENNIRGETRIMTTNDVEKNRRCGLSGGHGTYRLHTCYRDINDKSTLEFWLIYY